MSIVTLDELKTFLRVDDTDEDSLIEELAAAAEKLCADILRSDDSSALADVENAKAAVLYTTAYLYEHREEADHHALTLTLRAMLFGSREVGF